MKKQFFMSLLVLLISAIGYSETITRIEAESYTGNSGAKSELKPGTTPSGTADVGFIKNGTWIKFSGQVFSQYDTRFDVMASTYNGGSGNIEFRLDSTTGPLIGTATVSGAAGYKIFSAIIIPTTGTHDLYLVFTNTTNTGYLFNIDYFEKANSDANAVTYTLSTNAIPASSGTVTSSLGGGIFNPGTVVTLTAMPDFRYNFVQWVDENGAVVSTANPITVTMNQNTTRVAQFATIPFPDIASTQQQPSIPATQYVITEPIYGGSVTNLDNSAAINKAISAANAAGGGTVVIPADASPYFCGPITFKSNVNLFIAAGATLQLMPYGNGNGLPAGSYPNSGTADSYTALIYAENLTNIEISGTGTIEGNGSAWWAAYDATGVGRPGIIRFKACNKVLITDITIHNAPNVGITIGKSGSGRGSNATVKNVTIIAPSDSPNTDALDVWYWDGLDILNCKFSEGDDNVAVDANSQNVTIKNCAFGAGHGVSVGSYTSNVNHVTVDNCAFNGTSNGFRLKSAIDRGGNENTFSYSNVTMNNVGTPFTITSWYPKEPTASPSTLPLGTVTATTPTWTNITFKNITVTNSPNAGMIYGLPESLINNVIFDNVKIQATTGMIANFITGIEFKNCSSITTTTGNAITSYKAETVSSSNIINGINTTSGASTSCNLSVEDVVSATHTFSLYPNPVKGDNFIINTNTNIEKISIYTLSGAKIKELNGNNSTQQTVDIKGFSAGCYLVQIILDNGKMSTAKLIKE